MRSAPYPELVDDAYVELTAADLAHRWRERTVLESVDEAIAYAGDAEEYATPESALRWQLKLAWSDLDDARSSALNGRWSIKCEQQVAQIIGLTRLVGPTPWEAIPVDLLLDGVYERIHEVIGVSTPLTDDDRRRCRELKERRHR
jgi:hypothetical protein